MEQMIGIGLKSQPTLVLMSGGPVVYIRDCHFCTNLLVQVAAT